MHCNYHLELKAHYLIVGKEQYRLFNEIERLLVMSVLC